MQLLFQQIEQAGIVGIVLLVLAFILIYFLTFRYLMLRTSYRINKNKKAKDQDSSSDELQSAITYIGSHRKNPNLPKIIEEQYLKLTITFQEYEKIAGVLILSAPLLGLLGTVMGMRETFSSLTDQTMFSQNGGISAGISQAMLTTQLGLMVSIPAALVHGLIQQRKKQLLAYFRHASSRLLQEQA